MGNRKFMPPGSKKLQNMIENFKRDFDSIQPRLTRAQEIAYRFGPLDYDQLEGSSRLTQAESTNVETSLSTMISTNIGDPVTVESPEPTIVHAQLEESHNPTSSTASKGSTSPTTPIFDEAVNSGSYTATAREATPPVPYPTPPQTVEDDVSETEDSGRTSEETESTKDIISLDVDVDRSRHRTYQFHHCNTVYLNAFNAHGVKFKNSGNNAPQVIYNCGAQQCRGHTDLNQFFPTDFTRPMFDLPPVIPPLPFQESGDNSLYAIQSAPSRLERGQMPTSPRNVQGKLPVAIETSLMQGNLDDAIFGFQVQPGPDMELTPLKINTTEGHPIHMDFHPSFLLSSFPGAIQNANNNTADISSSQSNSHSRHLVEPPLSASSSRDPYLILLEQQLQSVLDTVLTIQNRLQTSSSGTSSLAEILTAQAQGILEEINALVSVETPVSSPRPTSTWRNRQCSRCESLVCSH